MKKLIAVFLLLSAGAAIAQHNNHNHNNGYYGHNRSYYGNPGWVAPLIIGGVVTYALTRPAVTQPVIVEVQPPVMNTDTMYINGVLYRRELVLLNGAYQQVWVSR